MNISLRSGQLELEAETIAEAFQLGEFFGTNSDNCEVGWSGDAKLHFDLATSPQATPPISEAASPPKCEWCHAPTHGCGPCPAKVILDGIGYGMCSQNQDCNQVCHHRKARFIWSAEERIKLGMTPENPGYRESPAYCPDCKAWYILSSQPTESKYELLEGKWQLVARAI